MDTEAAIAVYGHLELIREPELSDVCSSPPGWGLLEHTSWTDQLRAD
jgi:hypothetical protein